jgi:hypothetical protein
MQRANQVAKGIKVAFGKYTSGMRAFLGAGKKLVVVYGKADFFAIDINFGKAIGIEVNFGDIIGYFVPGLAWSYCH